MKRVVAWLIILSSVQFGWAQTDVQIHGESSVTFAIKNMGLTVEGTFKEFNGSIQFDPDKLWLSKFDVTLLSGSIKTGIELRDKHLKKEEYFDVSNYPKIHFVSTKIVELAKAGNYTLTGKLTIKKVTKEIRFDFTASKQGAGYLLRGEFLMDRRDYKVGGNSFSMGDEVKVFLSVASAIDKM